MEVDASACWAHWRAYVCMHEEHQTMIGPGIVRVTAQSIQGTKDPNRQGRQRVDLVLHQLGGSYVRVHPGRHKSNDAALKVSPPSASEHGASATNQWTRIWSGDGVFTKERAKYIAQGDWIGRKQAWHQLSSLNDPVPVDITDGSQFLWWLWVAGFGNGRA